MESTGILTTIAGIAMSFVGFTGLLITFRGGSSHGEFDEFEVYQLMTVVVVGLTVLFGCLGVIVFADFLGENAALRVTSAGLLVLTTVNGARSRRRVGQLRVPAVTERETLLFTLVAISAGLMFLTCILAPALPLFELAMVLLLAIPALVFRVVLMQLAQRR